MNPIPFADLADEFLECYYPPARAKTTCRMMRQAVRELGEDDRIETSQDLSPAAIHRWLKRRPDRKPITAAAHLRNLRVLCNYAVGRAYLSGSPFAFDAKLAEAAGVTRDSRRRHHSLDEIGRVLGHLRDRAYLSWEDHRLFALASLVAFTGVRALEAAYAEVDDLDLEEGFFRVEPKPNHPLKTKKSERDVPLPPQLVPHLRRWLPKARSNWAFPGVRRIGPWVGGLAGYRPLDMLKEAGQAVGISGFTFLSLRHSYMTHGSGPWHLGVREIQQIAGHSLPSTQEHYLGRDRANLTAAVAAISIPFPSRASAV